MKTETITVTTTKSISDISNILRNAASKLRANISTAELSPFGYVNFRRGDIEIALSGSNSILGGPRKWGVQVLVIDNGSTREVELTAIGDDFMNKLSRGSFGNAFFELKDGISRANTIARRKRSLQYDAV